MNLVLQLAQRSLIGLGLIALIYTGGAMAYAELYQRRASSEFQHRSERVRLAEAPPIAEREELREGDMVGRLDIPATQISVMVLHGVGDDNLRLGAGHVPGTPLPGGSGNSAMAAHRDTFFRKLQGIRPGDAIHFSTESETFEYVVEVTEIVEPSDTRAMESRGYDELTLITCYPFYFVGSAPQRFIVHARRTETRR